MDRVKLCIYDEDTQETFTLLLTSQECKRAQNDMAYRTDLLNYARNERYGSGIENILTPCVSNTFSSIEASGEMDSFASVTTNEEDASTMENEELMEGGFTRWSHEAILLLLEAYRQRERAMYSGKISHKKAWEEIAEVINNEGYIVTAKQCTTRVNTMKRIYKNVKDHNNKSGNNKRTWKYYDVMENLLGEKPYITPMSTISSTGAETHKAANTSLSIATETEVVANTSFCSSSDDQSSKSNVRVSRKRKGDATMDQKTMEENKERRHKERLQSNEKIMNKLDQLLERLSR
ncbi:uncharacterized protein LOC143893606 isoform X1 [Temnothorax americanus]|uniref:uncharacterized protein LOC143893606 isoform X1 n=1 Tax=Temnothorax americanus TaxID=1964332 RepID=UPI0040677C67